MQAAAIADAYSDLSALDAARSHEALTAELLRVADGFGAGNVLALVVPDERAPAHRRARDLLIDRWPSDWIEFYAKSDYVYIDPVVVRPMGEVRLWREAFGTGCDRSALRILEGAKSCRLHDGVTFNFLLANGRSAIVSIAGERADFDAGDLPRLSLLSHFALGKALALRARNATQPQAPGLTRRERDVLMWTCDGKTEWEIGEILGISEHSADKYVRALKTKLGAASKTHLVAQAFRFGLV